jgi:hypothetical protein
VIRRERDESRASSQQVHPRVLLVSEARDNCPDYR